MTPPSALEVISAEVLFFGGGEAEVRPMLNTSAAQPLAPVDTADPAKWTCLIGGVLYTGVNIEIVTFNVLRVFFVETDAQSGSDSLDYSNAPSDVSDTLGRQLAAFEMPL